MAAYASHKGQIMLAIQEIVVGLTPTDMVYSEVAIRENWLNTTGDPMRGVSIIDMGEQYDDGTVGTADIGYIVGVVFAKFRTGDATLSDDKIIQWYEQVRRRFQDQRVLITLGDDSAPKEHVCIIMPGKTLTDLKKWPNYLVRQLVVVSWIRELPTQY